MGQKRVQCSEEMAPGELLAIADRAVTFFEKSVALTKLAVTETNMTPERERAYDTLGEAIEAERLELEAGLVDLEATQA